MTTEKREPNFGTFRNMDKAARRASKQFTAAPSFLVELAADLRDDEKRAESKRKPSTSVTPVRCRDCREWNQTDQCRFCRSAI